MGPRTLYWTDWNREAPKIECSTVDGDNRKVVVSEGIGLPNALTYDTEARQICWADAGKVASLSRANRYVAKDTLPARYRGSVFHTLMV